MRDRYEEDDNRVLADMSEIERPSVLLPDFGRKGGPERRRTGDRAGADRTNGPAQQVRPDDHFRLSRSERRSMILGGITAGLLIVAVFAAAFAALILLVGHLG